MMAPAPPPPELQEERELEHIANVGAARDVLRKGLEKSRDIGLAIQESSAKLDNAKKRLELLKGSFKDVAWKCNLDKVGRQVDGALGPAASVLRIFLVIQDLQASLLTTGDADGDLRQYLATVQRIEDAARLLKDNSELVTLWLQDALQFLNAPDDEWYVLMLQRSMKILGQMQGIEQGLGAGGGILTQAFHQLENEFTRILIDHSFLPCSFSSDDDQGMALIPSPLFPASDIHKLQLIMERLAANNRLQRCASIYVEVRSSNVRTALQGLDVHYLHLSLSQYDSVQSLECYLDQWGSHLQFAVKYLLEIEYTLCHQVFHNADDLGMHCFAGIVLQSGFYDFIKFGNAITQGKKEAIKLLRLLDIFTALDKLRLDFNRLFSEKWCEDIQTQTRELIRRVIDGACEIFWDLSVQVEAQRPTSAPPLDGRVPRLVRFVTDFCNALLEDGYRTGLLEVLEIHCSWNKVEFDGEGILSSQLQRMMRALELNVQAWSEVYKEDMSLSHFFRVNNYWHLCESIKATKLGGVMGDEWLAAYREEMEHYLAVYLRESWEKLPAFLSEDGLVLFPGGRAFDRDLARKRLNEFTAAFENTYTKQIYWVLSDKGLRLRTRHLITQAIIPCYDNYVRKYMPRCDCDCEGEGEGEGEGEDATNKDVKYSSASLQDMINFLFQPKQMGKYGSPASTKSTNGVRVRVSVSKKNAVASRFSSSTPALA